jgi:signal peptidase I
MEPTLLVGDYILVEKLTTPKVERGEIVMVRFQGSKFLTLNRVVGLPGDRIRIVNKQLLINEKPLGEPYVVHRAHYLADFRDNFPATPNINLEAAAQEMLRRYVADGQLIVPQGNYFAMGDNRDLSNDSRFMGFVAQDGVLGKPVMVYWSVDSSLDGKNWWVRWDRIFHRIQ